MTTMKQLFHDSTRALCLSDIEAAGIPYQLKPDVPGPYVTIEIEGQWYDGNPRSETELSIIGLSNQQPNKTYVPCPHCEGTGMVGTDQETMDHCPMCEGVASVTKKEAEEYDDHMS